MALGCPKCGCAEVRRSVRRDWEWLLLGILPYRCPACGRRFYAFGKRRHSDDPMEQSPAGDAKKNGRKVDATSAKARE